MVFVPKMTYYVPCMMLISPPPHSTPLCGYVLSTGPTEGLSSWWLRNWSPPTAYNNNNNTPTPRIV